jgi:hypothetical protein
MLDTFDDQNGDLNTRIVYSLLVAQIFRRLCLKFGLNTGRIVLRNLYSLFHTIEQANGKATAARIQSSLSDKGSKGVPPPPPTNNPQPGDMPGRGFPPSN